jgi:D-alanyl-D-alanine carboxypeptidase/D-alanyl-D-alanine-endopeptidase (penicillin-binding protein 4)
MKNLPLLLLLALLSACTASRTRVRSDLNPLDTLLNAPGIQSHHVGVLLVDVATGETVYHRNAGRYFTPASNTKLFTAYAALKILGDSIEALRYEIRGDSLLFAGTGDPSLLNPNVPSTRALDFLRSRPEKLFWIPGDFRQPVYGAGWAWDDFNDSYQPELTELPIYGNVVRFTGTPDGRLSVSPASFWANAVAGYGAGTGEVRRERDANVFRYPALSTKPGSVQEVPFRTSVELTAKLLGDTLGRRVEVLAAGTLRNPSVVRSLPTDTLVKWMLLPSDNFVAEQLLLLTGTKRNQPPQTADAIRYVTQTHLTDLPDAPRWVDGSGLSRYNLVTPRTLVALLQKLYAEVPRARLFALLPTGGQAGTLRSMFPETPSYVFAKSGSLSGVYNLSGYLLTRSGRTLAFSVMNNHFTRPVGEIRRETERLLRAARERF